jgi:hypothetical protein
VPIELFRESRQIAGIPEHAGLMAVGTIGGAARDKREEKDSRDV